MNDKLIDKKVYHFAKYYLPAQSIEGVTASFIENYLNRHTALPSQKKSMVGQLISVSIPKVLLN
jgi:hypothetical protein